MRGRCTLLIWLFFLALPVAQAQATVPGRQTVRWLSVDFPPLFMTTADEHGVGDYAQGVAVAQLTDFDHVLQAVPANYQRIEQEMKAHADICFAGLLKTPDRERFMAFSQPYLLMLPVQLFVPAASGALPLTEDGRADLQNLLASGGFRLGILGGRRYGPSVDSVIDAYPQSPPVYRRYSKDQLTGLLNMMAARDHGVDGVLAYPIEITYMGPSAGNLRGYALKGAPDYVFGYFACSNSNLGRAVIAEIDRTIPDIRAQVAALYARNLAVDGRPGYSALLKRAWGITLPPDGP